MKKQLYLITMLAGLLSFQSCSNNRSKQNTTEANRTDTAMSEPSNPADTASTDMNEFALKAASGGMMEVELGQIAQRNAQNQRVKNFGKMMVKDHTKANDELKALAAKKNITLPATLSADHQEHVDKLRKLTGADFDKHYMDMMTDDHKKDIDEFEKASKNSTDADIKAFATATLPVLRTHLDSAEAIKKAVKK